MPTPKAVREKIGFKQVMMLQKYELAEIATDNWANLSIKTKELTN